MNIRSIKEEDISEVRKLIDYCKPLDLHTPFTYWILAKYFNNTCLVLEDKDHIVGYVGGMKSTSNEDVFYLWQIGLMPEYRGTNCFQLLLDEAIKAAKLMGCRVLQFSALSDNLQSIGAFSSYARKKSVILTKKDSLKFYDELEDEEFLEDIYELPL